MMKTILETTTIESIPILSLTPANGKAYPVVFYIPGYGLGKESGLSLGYKLARKGLGFISIDPLYHGERYDQILDNADDPDLGGIYPPQTGLDTGRVFYRVIAHCLQDIQTLLRHFRADPRFDTQVCGVTGPSQGGCASFLVFANLTEIKAAVPMIGIPNFSKRWTDLLDETSFSNPDWARALAQQQDQTQDFTDFIQEIDPYQKLTGIDPKPLLIMNCDFDSDQPKIYSVDLYRAMLPNYQAYPDYLKLRIYPTGHQVTEQMEADAVDWFSIHLRR